jgi:hypothetical protein
MHYTRKRARSTTSNELAATLQIEQTVALINENNMIILQPVQ